MKICVFDTRRKLDLNKNVTNICNMLKQLFEHVAMVSVQRISYKWQPGVFLAWWECFKARVHVF